MKNHKRLGCSWLVQKDALNFKNKIKKTEEEKKIIILHLELHPTVYITAMWKWKFEPLLA